MNINIIKNISSNKITLLKDINSNILIDKRGKFQYFYIPNFEIRGVRDFISKIDENSIYTVIPIISRFAKDNDPHIILSKQILFSY